MTTQQAATLALIGAVMAALVWDRVRYDVVAAVALVTAVALGVVPAAQAFAGFSDDIVIIVGSALVVSAAVERSGLVDRAVAPLARHLDTMTKQVAVLGLAVALLSGFMKNIGALAIFLPVAVQVARRHGLPPSRLLMPLSFASLLGGIATGIGTSPNIIVSRMRAQLLGQPFGMFDFAPVGLVLTVAGIAFLAVGWRLLPAGRSGAKGEPFAIADYTAEACLPPESPFVGRTVADIEDAADGEAMVTAIVRQGTRRYVPAAHWVLYPLDLLVLECDARVLQRLVKRAGLRLPEAPSDAAAAAGEQAVVEAVVTEGSPLIGSSAAAVGLRDRYGLNLLALSRRGEGVRVRLRRAGIRKGDLLVLQGAEATLAATLERLRCVPLAERSLDLAPPRAWVPAAILAAAMAAAGSGLVPVAVAFFAAATAMLVSGSLTLNEAYQRIEWPILVLLGCLIPLSTALEKGGGAALIAGWLAHLAAGLPMVGAVALVLAVAMAVTPFLNNAATVLMLAPVAVTMAQRLNARPDAFLMAVAIGAACDFLTPVGHQCNTLVMGPGGYRFGDYARLGAPLSLMVLAGAPPLLMLLWPPG